MTERSFWQNDPYRETTHGTGQPATVKPIGRVVFNAPTAEQLHKHAARFGPEGVAEVAGIYGIDMTVTKDAPKPARKRHTTADLEAQVLELEARGVVDASIADTLNVSDRRVGSILRTAAAA